MRSNRASRLAFLYPGHAAEDDYPRAASLLGGLAELEVVHTTVGEDAHREDALRDTGDLRRLLAGAAQLDRHGLACVLWACTSASFVFGLEGARRQAEALATVAGVPASSTSLAFVDAAAALGIGRVAIAATYPAEVVDLFVAFLAAAGIETANVGALGIVTGVEAGTCEPESVLRLARATDVPDAEAVLVPDTALHTIAHLQQLESALGKPVLTANQVTVWQAVRLAGLEPPARPELGQLFETQVVVG